MNDERIWVRYTPMKIKFLILVSIFISNCIMVFFGLLFFESLYILKTYSGSVTVTYLSSHYYTYDSNFYYTARMIIAFSLTMIHAFCTTSIKRYRSLNAPLVLIGSYLLILIFFIAVKSFAISLITLLLIALWITCLYKLKHFEAFKNAFWVEYHKKELDPYGLLELHPSSSTISDGSSKSFYESYGNELIDPIKVDLKKIETPKKQESHSTTPKRYF